MGTTAIVGLAVLLLVGGLTYYVMRRRPELPHSVSELPEAVREPTEPIELEELGGEGAPEASPTVRPLRSTPPPAPVTDASVFRAGLKSTRGNLISRLAGIFTKDRAFDESILDEVEEVLITADVGVHTSQRILEALRSGFTSGDLSSANDAWSAIRSEATAILGDSGRGLSLEQTPTVILVVGVNGVGKTTTIGKLASRFARQGRTVLLAAGDTFRAAAVTQLEVWGRRVGCDVVKGKDRADPGSVIYDAIQRGIDERVDVVIADTAGRLHTKVPLMDELNKIGRTTEKALGRAADHVLLVLDATTGQNAIQQAQLFKDALPVSAIALTKLDGTAKGGVILGIVDQHGVPVEYVGVGERVEDLKPFAADAFVEALFEAPEQSEEAANGSAA